MKKDYLKLYLQSHPDKNNHTQASDAFSMINEANQGLEGVLRHNYSMRRTQDREEDLQRQEEAWIKYKQIMKSPEESEELKKQAVMDAYMIRSNKLLNTNKLQIRNGTREGTRTCPYGTKIYRNFVWFLVLIFIR